MKQFKTYKQKLRKGMEPIGDQAREWMTQKDWDEIDARIERLKASGEYGQEYETTYNMMSIPEFDEPVTKLMEAGFLIPRGMFKENDKEKKK
jgi:hypothetical protein